MSRPVPEIERELLATYISTHWKRSVLSTFELAPEIPDPGHGRDEISPFVWYGGPFDPGKPEDLADLSTFAVQEVAGYAQFEATVLDGIHIGEVVPVTSQDGSSWFAGGVLGGAQVVPRPGLVDGEDAAFYDTAGVFLFNASVTGGPIHGSGFVTGNITAVGPGGPNARGYIDTGRSGTQVTRVRLSLLVAAKSVNCPRLPDQYAGAFATLLNGVDFIRDASAAEGTLLRDMADAKFLALRQLSKDPIPGRANHLYDDRGWRWYLMQVVFTRHQNTARAGRRSPVAA